MAKKLALGKGLSALISDAVGENISHSADFSSSQEGYTSITDIPIDRVVTNPYQPRATFDEEALEDLSESIKTLGLIQPITVRRVGNNFQIISGERRFRASQMAGLKYIPAYIREADDQGMLEMAIVENIQRQDLDAIEIAISFKRLIDECNLTQEGMADRVGKKRATVTNYLRLLKLPAHVQAAIRHKLISMGHAKALLSIEDEQLQLQLCESIITKDLSVRQLESKIKDACNDKPSLQKNDKKEITQSLSDVSNILGKFFNNKVNIKRNSKGRGSITLNFSNDYEIELFLKALKNINS
jgi:ParB family transcriptional regulator, chromosome partitioning protein